RVRPMYTGRDVHACRAPDREESAESPPIAMGGLEGGVVRDARTGTHPPGDDPLQPYDLRLALRTPECPVGVAEAGLVSCPRSRRTPALHGIRPQRGHGLQPPRGPSSRRPQSADGPAPSPHGPTVARRCLGLYAAVRGGLHRLDGTIPAAGRAES